MAAPSEPTPGRLIVGLLAAGEQLLALAEARLAEEFAAVELRSETIPFDFTRYYEPEFGAGLLRRWVCPAGRFRADQLSGLKLLTNKVESGFAAAGRRRVNIDPGIVTRQNVVLASCKDFAHRVSIGSGVFAEVTMIYRGGDWRPLEWTYPDYRTETCLDFLRRCRATLR